MIDVRLAPSRRLLAPVARQAGRAVTPETPTTARPANGTRTVAESGAGVAFCVASVPGEASTTVGVVIGSTVTCASGDLRRLVKVV